MLRAKPVLLVDFDGTLCHDRFWQNLPQQEFQLIQNFLFRQSPKLLDDWMRGRISSEDICNTVSSLTGLNSDYLVYELEQSCRSFKVDPALLKKLATLSQSYRLALITTNMDCFEWVSDATLPAGLFPNIFNSADYGHLKNDADGQLFRIALSRLSTAPEDCTLIDDSEQVCQLFRQLGGTALQVTNPRPMIIILETLANCIHAPVSTPFTSSLMRPVI